MHKIVLTHIPGFHGYCSRHVIDFSARTGISEAEIIIAAIDDYADSPDIIGFPFDDILKYCYRDIGLEIDQPRFEKLQSVHHDIEEAMRIAIAKFFADVFRNRCISFPHLNSTRKSPFLEMLARALYGDCSFTGSSSEVQNRLRRQGAKPLDP